MSNLKLPSGLLGIWGAVEATTGFAVVGLEGVVDAGSRLK
jgi:hypothetical protein